MELIDTERRILLAESDLYLLHEILYAVGRESMRKLNIKLLAAIVTLTLFLPLSEAAEYPNKTIQIINPFPPGAVTDIVARIVAPKMSTALGQQVIVVNRAGGGAAVGIQAAKDAAPDGYTILVTPPPILLIPIVNKNSGF